MKTKIVLVSGAAVLVLALAVHAAEKTRFTTDASEWTSDTLPVPGLIMPIGGSGQVNGNFVTGERNGIQVALRASRRFFQNVDPLVNYKTKKQVAEYLADTGTSDAAGNATWNFDLHVDLRAARGVAQGTALGDYDLTLSTDIFGATTAIDLAPFAGPAVVLWQQSVNPRFGNPGFDVAAERAYTFTLTLQPKTFKGPPISVAMRVVVQEP